MKNEEMNVKIDLYLEFVKVKKSSLTYRNYANYMLFWKEYSSILHSQELLNEFLWNEENKNILSFGKIQTLRSFLKWLNKRYPQMSNIGYADYESSNKLKKEKIYKNIEIDNIENIIQTIIERSNPKIGLMSCFYIYFQYYSGLRIAELFENNIEDFKPNKNYSKFQIIGKGNKERSIFVGERLIPFTFKPPYQNIRFFSEIFNEIQKIKINKGGYVWKSNLYKATIENANKWCKEKYENFPHFSTHYFRYSFAYRLIDTGTPLVAVQWFMGHSDISTTAKYIHFPYNDLEYYYRLSDIGLVKSLDISVYKDQEKTLRKVIFKLLKALKKYEDIDLPQFLNETEREIIENK